MQFKHPQTGQSRELTPSDKANLSHWIYRHNWNAGLLQPIHPQALRQDIHTDPRITAEQYLTVTHEVANNGWLRRPAVGERLLYFVRELVWQIDRWVQSPQVAQQEHWAYPLFLRAAAGCAADTEMREFWDMAEQQGWESSNYRKDILTRQPWEAQITLHARLWVEEQTRIQGSGKQGFVAMWIDPNLNSLYDQGFKLAIQAAGYEPRRIDDDPHHSDNLVDRILAAIRQSRFVVADFTCGQIQDAQGNTVYLDRGGVYYEAGFAYGLGIPVIYTCQQDVVDRLHFDIRQLNHLLWGNEEELVHKLQARIERQFGRGPVS